MKIVQNTLKIEGKFSDVPKKFRVGPKKVGSVGFPEMRHFFLPKQTERLFILSWVTFTYNSMRTWDIQAYWRDRKKKKSKGTSIFWLLVFGIHNRSNPVSSFNLVGLTEKSDKKYNILELERKKIEEIKE